MINIAISGASGKMGNTLIRSVIGDDALTLTAAVDHDRSGAISKDAATLIGLDACGATVQSDLVRQEFDLLIDFTRPAATLDYLDDCIKMRKPMVIGTTGFSDSELTQLREGAGKIPILLAPNMSVGVNLSFKLIEVAARALADTADIEIIEAHHRHKVDAPSGTALAMGETISNALDRRLDECGIFTRHGHTGERKTGQIGFSVIRAGDIVGDHTALFALDGERIEITHKAADRTIYANGAIRAAKWLALQTSPGLYNMQNVLGLG